VRSRPTVGASVDVGSNSVHLLVAEIADGHRIQPLADESVFLGLGAAVDARAHLGSAARAELTAALGRYAATARGLGATGVTFIGTEPIRRAGDAARVVAEVDVATGVPLLVLSHEEEAYLTLIGVTAGPPVTDETLVVDIGGGSSEFCAVAAGGTARAAGLGLGSGRLSRYATSDPVDADAIKAMRAAADDILRDTLPATPADLIAVGGTASNLLKVTSAGESDPILTRERVREALATLTASPGSVVAERYVLNPKRAPLLPAGAVIVDALMDRYGVDRVRVSEASLREGAVLVADHAGPDWRDSLAELAHGWRR
jgi:exopolyphosphatase / guanosine-5'-triphosphate,3'-diphosphate pyrophosphatase